MEKKKIVFKKLTDENGNYYYEAYGRLAIEFAIEIDERNMLGKSHGGLFTFPGQFLDYYTNMAEIYGWDWEVTL